MWVTFQISDSHGESEDCPIKEPAGKNEDFPSILVTSSTKVGLLSAASGM